MRIPFRTLATALALTLAAPAHAGRYPASGTQTFNYPDNTQNLGDGAIFYPANATSFSAVQGNPAPFARLSKTGATGNLAAFKLPNLDPGKTVESFSASFTVKMKRSSTTSVPGGGWAFCFGPIPSGEGLGPLGYTMNGGIVVSFDTLRNTPSDFPSIEVFSNNTTVGNVLASSLPGAPLASATTVSFSLKNPVTGGTTVNRGNLSASSSAATVQTHMRTVSGWESVVVTGPNGGPWIVDRGVVGAYANPEIFNYAVSPSPGGSTVLIASTQEGNATTSQKWEIKRDGPGFNYDDTFRTVSIHWDYNGLDVTYDGNPVFTNLATPGFAPSQSHTFAFTALNEEGGQDTLVDDLVIATTEEQPLSTGLIVSEFMAENSSTLEDEDMDSPDWIEIYNGSNATINLGGYKLTNGAATWTFPSTTLGAYSHLVLFASGKNRATNPALYHTNFTLPKTGGTLSLLTPTNVVASTYTYPNQFEDISYGIKYQGGAVGFLDTSSPGAGTLFSYIVSPNGPAEDLVWSRDGGIISATTTLGFTAPIAPGSVVRYTTDNSLPTASSPVLTGAINVTTSANFRARVFTPGRLPGPVSSRTFLFINSSLSNYNNSGQSFKSHLPVIVMDSFGTNVDAVTDQAQARPHRYTYSVVIDKDASGFADIVSPTVNFQGRSGTHVRGDSSGGFAQKSYAWETWNNFNEDKDVSILGFPADSDWALYGPYTDKTFIRNFIVYSKMRELHGGGNGFGMRVKMVELFYNQTANQPIGYDDYRGVYVLMERIKRGKDRIDIEKLNSLTTDPALITGGYIFRQDRVSSDGTTVLVNGMNTHTPGILNTAQAAYLNGYITSFQSALNGANFADPVLGYAPFIERESFIDNWWFVEICKQIDGYRLSTYFTKSRSGKIVAAPIWDYNLSLGNADYLAGDQPTGWYWNQTDSYWWARLRQDPNYEQRNWDRYWELRRGIFANSSINAYIDQLASIPLNGSTTPVTNNMSLASGQPSTLENAAMRHYRKYPILGVYVWPNAAGFQNRIYFNSNGNPVTGEIDWMKNWLSQRLSWLDDQNFGTGTTIFRPPNFSHMGGNVPSGTQVTITPYSGTAPSGYSYATGTIYYTTDGSDPKTSSTSSAETTLIPGSGAPCKWLVPSVANGGTTLTAASGANQWTSYTNPPNIANWTTATTGIGYDTAPDYLPLIGPGGNTQSQMQGINATCYVRVEFNIPNQATLDSISTLNLGMKYDDGFRAYINGVHVAGGNDADPSTTADPANAFTPNPRDEAAAVQFETFNITPLGKPALRVGTNVLAIHCLNGANSGSSDLLMVPKLTYFSGGTVVLTTSSTLKARLLSGVTWSPITTAEFVVNAVPASASNIVVSEFLYNPAAASPAEIAAGFGDNDFEFIELMNVGPGSVDMSGCNLSGGVNFDFDVADPVTLTLAPGQRIIVAANLAAFNLRNNPAPGTKIAGAFGGSLSNQGESFSVLDAANNPIATVAYLPTAPWPIEANTLGYSLVLNNPASGAAYGASAWRISAQPGGTPGNPAGPAFGGHPSGDSDGDGFSDFLEYALGESFTIPGSQNRPAAGLQTHSVNGVPGNYLTFNFRRNNAADGVNYFVELSSNLTGWASDSSAVTFVGSAVNGDGTSTVTYRATQPYHPAVPQFMRLKVSP
jgi:hypothetical protein